MATLLAATMLVALLLYALTGGADYGGGLWDLLARGPRAKEQRALIARIIAPIWEANHVWLILVVVLMFVGFPTAFARISTSLHIPLLLMLFGVVLRGAAFTFRAYGKASDAEERRWGQIFGAASAGTPVMLGICLGAAVNGQVTANPGDFISPWATPFPLCVGVMCLCQFAFLAATYLTVEADERELTADFARKALRSGAAAAVAASLALILAGDAFRTGLLGSAASLALMAGAVVATGTAGWSLQTGRFVGARRAAVVQTSLLVAGLGAATWPYILPPDLSIVGAAAPDSVLKPILYALLAGAVLLVPAMAVLFRLFTGIRAK